MSSTSPETLEERPTGRTEVPVEGFSAFERQGLLHDARNLMATIGLYCDLLQMPGVLNAKYRCYAQEMVHLGRRACSFVDRVMNSVSSRPSEDGCIPVSSASVLQSSRMTRGTVPADRHVRISLWSAVENCSGLLERIAGAHKLEVKYGEAAAMPIAVPVEVVERILVNLVRNSAAALDRLATGEPLSDIDVSGDKSESAPAIRIGVGLLTTRVGEPRPWPFRHVRLTVEDSGCGMCAEQIERLLQSPERISASHGIGFNVVRQLAETSNAEVKVASVLGRGTCVQIEWPVPAEAHEPAESEEPLREADFEPEPAFMESGMGSDLLEALAEC